MDASDLIKTLQNTLRGGGRPHVGLGLVVRSIVIPVLFCLLPVHLVLTATLVCAPVITIVVV